MIIHEDCPIPPFSNFSASKIFVRIFLHTKKGQFYFSSIFILTCTNFSKIDCFSPKIKDFFWFNVNFFYIKDLFSIITASDVSDKYEICLKPLPPNICSCSTGALPVHSSRNSTNQNELTAKPGSDISN